ncbi:DUF2262 domain-containing protein [Butyrivibrio fibrisolvens]|uniref:DUF2262 domain-containing protein n=1 Tax=Butyrivibrio fibrisolvens TaxID=831 RepID=UPI000402B6AD|nr:DUF2262 domain-containing protein [Butyrivibrio fibrisolvens]
MEKFENEFETEEKEITVLLKDSCTGASVMDKKWLKPSVNFLASINNNTGEVVNEEGRLEWIIENDPHRKGWGYDFKQFGIYRLLVRKCFPRELAPYQSAFMNNRYLLIKILEEDVQNEKLIELQRRLSKIVEIDTPYGKFELDRSMSWFEAEIECCGYTFTVFLETDEENGEKADDAREVFLKTLNGFEEFDKKMKDYAARNLLDSANEWLESKEGEHELITEEKFIEAMEISEMTVSPDGSMTMYYSDGDMFWGHSIEISVDEDGTISDVGIAG